MGLREVSVLPSFQRTLALDCFLGSWVWISDPSLPLLLFLMPTIGHCRLETTLWLCFDKDEGRTSCLVTRGIQAGTRLQLPISS